MREKIKFEEEIPLEELDSQVQDEGQSITLICSKLQTLDPIFGTEKCLKELGKLCIIRTVIIACCL